MPDDHKLRLGDAVGSDSETWVRVGVRRGKEAKLRRDGSSNDWQFLPVPEWLVHAATARRDVDPGRRSPTLAGENHPVAPFGHVAESTPHIGVKRTIPRNRDLSAP
ncbi:hypothetical protein QE406_001042 [Microbacterium testaceum]|nr:hypothetical protein [Microbacterium testaceum]